MERGDFFPLQASLVGCTSLGQEDTTFLLQADLGVKPETTNSEQVAAREEFARPSKKRQQRKVTAWCSDQTKQFGPEG